MPKFINWSSAEGGALHDNRGAMSHSPINSLAQPHECPVSHLAKARLLDPTGRTQPKAVGVATFSVDRSAAVLSSSGPLASFWLAPPQRRFPKHGSGGNLGSHFHKRPSLLRRWHAYPRCFLNQLGANHDELSWPHSDSFHRPSVIAAICSDFKPYRPTGNGAI